MNGRRVLSVLTVLGMALSVLYIGSGAAPAAVDKARAEHERIVAFWTPERVAQAVPRDFVFEPGKGFRPAAPPPGKGKPKPPPEPPATIAKLWEGAGAVLATTGKVLFQLGRSYYVCSASVVADAGNNDRSLVLTAAHCAFDESGRDRKNTPEDDRFATNWMFIPEYDGKSGFVCSEMPYGCWTASALVVHDGYATAGGFNDQAVLHDFAFAVVDDTLETEVGTQAIGFTTVDNVPIYAFGYPAASPFDGSQLWYCDGVVGRDNRVATYRIGCDMTGGSSGGPWFTGFDGATGTGTLMSVNSYGYSGEDAMYGPIFNEDTVAVYESANDPNESGNRTVP